MLLSVTWRGLQPIRRRANSHHELSQGRTVARMVETKYFRTYFLLGARANAAQTRPVRHISHGLPESCW